MVGGLANLIFLRSNNQVQLERFQTLTTQAPASYYCEPGFTTDVWLVYEIVCCPQLSNEKEREEKALREDNTKTLDKLKDQLQTELSNSEAGLRSKAQIEVNELRDKLNKELATERESVRVSLERELEEVRKGSETQLDKRRQEIETEHQKQLEQLQLLREKQEQVCTTHACTLNSQY